MDIPPSLSLKPTNPDYIDEVLAGYSEWLRSENRGSPKTIETRTYFIRRCIATWGIDGFTARNIRTFLAQPVRDRKTGELKPPEPWTQATYHGHLKSFTRWAFIAEVIPEYPFSSPDVLRRPKVPQQDPRPISREQLDLVLDVATRDQRAWVMLAALAGLRSHEVAKIKGQDVQRDNIHVRGKGGKRASISTHELLWDLAQDFPRIGFWFPSARTQTGHVTAGTVSTSVGRLFDRLGIEGSLHRCRHYFGTTMVEEDVDLRTIQQLMRHASLATTQTYTAVGDKRLKDAISRIDLGTRKPRPPGAA